MKLIFIVIFCVTNLVFSAEPLVSSEEGKWLLEAEKKSQNSNILAQNFLQGKITLKSSAALDYALYHYASLSKNYAVAEVALKNALKKMPDFFRAKLALSQLYIDTNKLSLATRLLQEVLLDGYDKRFEVNRLLGQIYLQEKKYIMAERSFLNALELQDDLACNKGLLQCYLEFADFYKASSLARELLLKNSHDEKIWSLAVNLELAKGHEREALIKILAAEKLCKLSDSLLLLQAQLLFRFNHHARAAQVYEKIIGNSKLSDQEIINFCEAQIQLGNAVLVKDLVNSLKQIDEKNVLLSKIAIEENDFELAKKLLNSVIEKSPLHESAIIALATLLKEDGEYRRASDFLRRLGENANALIILGQIAVTEGKIEAAEDFFQRSLKLNYQTEVANYLQRLQKMKK